MPVAPRAAANRDTKGSHLSSRHLPESGSPWCAHLSSRQLPENGRSAEKQSDPVNGVNLYELLGVSRDVEPEELKLAYRQKALVEHPDKGGDQDTFDAIQYAFKLLQDPEKRLEYDERLVEEAANTVLVEGKPEHRSTGEGFAHKKTAPRIGSTRQKDWHKQKDEWAGERSGAAVLENIRHALTDASAPADSVEPMTQKSQAEMQKEQTEALFKKFSTLPSGSKAKKQWVDSLTGKQKQALKLHAKAHEAEAMEKAKKWLAK